MVHIHILYQTADDEDINLKTQTVFSAQHKIFDSHHNLKDQHFRQSEGGAGDDMTIARLTLFGN
jgi:hypothetical protein